MSSDSAGTLERVEDLVATLRAARRYNIGFPGATDLDFTALTPVMGLLLNNVGDPYVDGIAANQSKAIERDVLNEFAYLLRAPAGDWWGYVTSGGSEGNLYSLLVARDALPDPVVYFTTAAHPSIAKAAAILGLPSIVVCADGDGQMDYLDLGDQVELHRHRSAIVVANIGTTGTEAIDDVHRITEVLDSYAIGRRHIHADAALSGIPLALLPAGRRPGFDFADGADSITVSGHKYFGVPTSCGVVVVRNSLRRQSATNSYAGCPDTTLLGSRSGHTPLMIWHALQFGWETHQARAQAARELAAYTLCRLTDIGWPAQRANELGFTVVLDAPPAEVSKKWVLAAHGTRRHIITMPGINQSQIDDFISDLVAARDLPDSEPTPRTTVPARSRRGGLSGRTS